MFTFQYLLLAQTNSLTLDTQLTSEGTADFVCHLRHRSLWKAFSNANLRLKKLNLTLTPAVAVNYGQEYAISDVLSLEASWKQQNKSTCRTSSRATSTVPVKMSLIISWSATLLQFRRLCRCSLPSQIRRWNTMQVATLTCLFWDSYAVFLLHCEDEVLSCLSKHRVLQHKLFAGLWNLNG